LRHREQPRLHAVAESAAYREDAARVRRLIDERVVMEAGFAHLASERIDADTLGVLDAAIAEMDAAATWADFHASDKRFHSVIATAAGLPSALTMYTHVTGELYRYFLPYTMSYLHTSNEQHKQIKTALENRDAALAARLLSAHAAELHRTMYVGLTGAGTSSGTRAPAPQRTEEE
ncbi:FCD domain-containing protein, partial [Streptomyces sp. PU-14G]|uniref:FCD domain-containing protein n=1 Tax=Streptomyces sp. PU-14G TaxID=2800808 RepID=UPI0034DEB197